jgi:tRNA threonylcarbamoyladenosine biosynthesis protein TsaE
MDALMIEEFLQSPWCLAVEWPGKIEGWLPPGTYHLHFQSPSETERTLRLAGGS